MIRVLFDRLLDMASIDVGQSWYWPDSDSISVKEIRDSWISGVDGNSTPYGDTWKHPVKSHKNKSYHVSRIIYFLNNPDEISGIEVENPCIDDLGILPGCQIVDGHHRIAAGIVLGLQYVDIEYGGRGDVEDYLLGKIDDRPDDILCMY